MLDNFTNLVLKLDLHGELSLGDLFGTSLTLSVNGKEIYYLPKSPATRLRRSVRGVVLRIPSFHRCDYFYDRDTYR